MKNLISTDSQYLIVGGGATGLSVARFLTKSGVACKVYDTRSDNALAMPFTEIDANIRVFLGEYDSTLLDGVSRVVLSPGVSRSERVVVEALEQDIPVLSDIKLFLEHRRAPVIGITGTNGKSTVTTLAGDVAKAAGLNVAVGGNLGIPALDLLRDEVDLYVLEVSSFQLESTDNANLDVAVNLNVSQDHLDRHGSLSEYFKAKQKIFHGAKCVIYNLHDKLTQPPLVHGVKRLGFGIASAVEKAEVQFFYDKATNCITRNGEALFDRNLVKLKGLHNLENILAVCAIADACSISVYAIEKAVAVFKGLEHRCEFVEEIGGVTFINDSKATNVGAVVSAIEGLSVDCDHIYLIAGGVGKGQDFGPLGLALQKHGVSAILYGQDAETIEQSLPDSVTRIILKSLEEAVSCSLKSAKSGDLILFSPACASFDLFKNYEERGTKFKSLVRGMAA